MNPLTVGIASGALTGGNDTPAYLDALQAAGSKGLRAQANWDRLEPSLGGALDFSAYDRIVDWAIERDMVVCAGLSSRDDRTFDYPREYAATAAKLAQHLEGRIAYMELGNEIDHLRCDLNPSPARYLELHLRSYEAIKAVAPSVRVGNGGIGGAKADWQLPGHTKTSAAEWLIECFRLGLLDALDVAMVHCYPGTGTIRDSIMEQKRDGWFIRQEHRAAVDYGKKDLPFVYSEIGWHTGEPNPITEAEQASRLTDAVAYGESKPWVEAMFWFTYSDSVPDPADPNNTGDTTGLVRVDGSHKPSYTAFTAAAA